MRDIAGWYAPGWSMSLSRRRENDASLHPSFATVRQEIRIFATEGCGTTRYTVTFTPADHDHLQKTLPASFYQMAHIWGTAIYVDSLQASLWRSLYCRESLRKIHECAVKLSATIINFVVAVCCQGERRRQRRTTCSCSIRAGDLFYLSFNVPTPYRNVPVHRSGFTQYKNPPWAQLELKFIGNYQEKSRYKCTLDYITFTVVQSRSRTLPSTSFGTLNLIPESVVRDVWPAPALASCLRCSKILGDSIECIVIWTLRRKILESSSSSEWIGLNRTYWAITPISPENECWEA